MIENYSIFDISEEEHNLILSAKNIYGKIFSNADELVKFVSGFIESVDEETYIFVSYLSHTYNSLLLALLSAIRMHEVQTAMNIRQALESGAKGAYALAFPKEDYFIIRKQDGTLEEKKDLSLRCYNWLKGKYPKESNIAKFLKQSINEIFAHANFIATQNITKYDKDKYWTMVFDKQDDLMIKKDLWLVANVAFGLISLFSKVSLNTKNIKLVSDFNEKLSKYNNATEEIKRELMTNPRFACFYT